MAKNPYSRKKDIPLESLTKAEAEKESKRRAFEVSEVIDTIGQESTTQALPHIREKAAVEEAEDREALEDKLTLLDDKRLWQKNDPYQDPYRKELVKMVMSQVRKTTWPPGYHFKALPTPEGVALLVMAGKTIYGHGFAPSMVVRYDLNAVNILVMQAENLIDRLETAKRPPARLTTV